MLLDLFLNHTSTQFQLYHTAPCLVMWKQQVVFFHWETLRFLLSKYLVTTLVLWSYWPQSQGCLQTDEGRPKLQRGDQHCQNNEVINKWIALLKNKTKKHAHIHLQKSISMNESSFSRLASVSPCYYHPVLSHQPFVLQILSWATFVTSPVSSSLLVVTERIRTKIPVAEISIF